MQIVYSIFFLIIFQGYAYAYIGPGLGLGAILTMLTFVGLIILAFFGVIFYPLKKIIVKLRKKKKRSWVIYFFL